VEAKNVELGQLSSGHVGVPATTRWPGAAGTYEVTASVAGFKKSVRPGIIVNVAATVRVDFQLEVGSAAESVTVLAEIPLLKTEKAENSAIQWNTSG